MNLRQNRDRCGCSTKAMIQADALLNSLPETRLKSAMHNAVEPGSANTRWLILTLVCITQFLFFGYVAIHRFVDSDEGYYLLASRLVLMRKSPYLDFFYMQAPLLPYVYGLWMRVAGVTWVSAKLFAALLTTLTGTLLYDRVSRETRKWTAGLVALMLFSCSSLIFAWFPVVKVYSLAELLLFSAYLISSRVSSATRIWLVGAAGLLFGLSISTRSYLLLLTPIFLWWLWINLDGKHRISRILGFLTGVALGNTLPLYLFLSSPSRFLFNNLGYHAIRSHGGLLGMWDEKLAITIFSLLGGPEGNGIQSSMLLLISFGFLFAIHKQNYRPKYAFVMAIGIGIISLLPTPVWPQYFALCMPFLIMSTVCVASEILAEQKLGGSTTFIYLACIGLLTIYFAASIPDFRRYLVTGQGVPGVKSAHDRDDWRLQRIIEVSGAVSQVVGPGETVASFWPGDIAQTDVIPLPGLENDSGLPISNKLNPEQQKKFHILSPQTIEQDLATHDPRVVVIRDQVLSAVAAEEQQRTQELFKSFRHLLAGNGYILVRSIGGVSIYVWSPKS